MRYEVEKRSKLTNRAEFDKVKLYLDKNAEFLGKKEMKSYLFQEPTFLRIRLIKGKSRVLITEKTGEYTDAGRPEKEHEISMHDLINFVRKKEKEGYQRCSLVHTTRYSYCLNGLNVELNEIDSLGLIVEIESITENKQDIPKIERKIKETMKELKLQELDANKYQKMMTKMYSQTLKQTKEHDFKI